MRIVILLGIILFSISCQFKKNNTATENMNTDSTKASWINTATVYEVNIRQYTAEGTFNAFAKELPRLRAMGVNTLWFMPITPIAQKNKKGELGSPYATSDYTAINTEFGTLDDFKSLVQQAHEQGFKVIIDWVANHTGWDHKWTKDHPKYYLKDSATSDFKIASGMDDIIELDYSNNELRDAMISAMKYWITQADIDGFRCDLASWVEVDFWKQARTELEKPKKLFWLGEFDPLENPDYMQVFDAAYTWKWMHATEDFYKKNLPLATLDTLLHQYDTVYGGNAMKLWFTSNHDENSWNGTEYEKYGKLALPLAVFSFTWDGIPLIYSGQELPNLKRLKFFEKDTIAWNGKYEMADFYKRLCDLKTTDPALRAGDKAVRTFKMNTDNANKEAIVFLRKNGENEVLVLLNFSNSRLKFKVNDDHLLKGNYKAVFGSKETIDFTNNKAFEMEPYGYLVYEKI